jgi:hypothetical protein
MISESSGRNNFLIHFFCLSRQWAGRDSRFDLFHSVFLNSRSFFKTSWNSCQQYLRGIHFSEHSFEYSSPGSAHTLIQVSSSKEPNVTDSLSKPLSIQADFADNYPIVPLAP